MAIELQAARTIRTARARANLTQAQLGARAGVTQSVISAYESGKRQPGVPALAALVDAAGFDLVVRRPPTTVRLGRPHGANRTPSSTPPTRS